MERKVGAHLHAYVDASLAVDLVSWDERIQWDRQGRAIEDAHGGATHFMGEPSVTYSPYLSRPMCAYHSPAIHP